MIKLANNLKFKIIISVFIVWGIIHFASYPLSYSKFIVEEDEFLKYNSNIVSLEKESNGEMSLISSDKTQAILEFSLEKNKNDLLEIESEKYQLILPKGCTTDSNEITFSSNEVTNVRLTCDITEENIITEDENNRKYLNISVKVNEIINDEMPFRYKEYSYYEEYQEPTTINEEVEVSKNKFDVDTFKTILYSSLMARKEYTNFTTEISSYIESAITSEDSFELLGISVDYQEEYNQYTYREDENFLGYARTYYANTKENNDKIMIFSSTKEEKLAEAYQHYIKSYYQFSNEDIALIRNYTNAKGNIGKIIATKEQIDGITYLDAYSMKLEDTIIEFARNTIKEKQFTIYNDNIETMMEVFFASINTLNIQTSLKEKINAREDIVNSITIALNKPNQKQYFLIKNEGLSILIEISYEDVNNNIRLLPLHIEDKEKEIDFIIEDSKNEMLTDENINSVMSLLEKEFDGTIIKDSLIRQEEGENFKIIFKIQKNEKEEEIEKEQEENKDLTDNNTKNSEQIDSNSDDTNQQNQEQEDNTIQQNKMLQDESATEINEVASDNVS